MCNNVNYECIGIFKYFKEIIDEKNISKERNDKYAVRIFDK